MLWLKRNLFVAAGGLLALILLVIGSLYLFGALGRNTEVDGKIEEVKRNLDQYYNRKEQPFPSVTNINIARQQKQVLSEYSAKAVKLFAPIPHDKKVRGQEFKQLLDNTLYDLRRQADQAGVALPLREYAFSFTAQKSKLTFSADTFPAVVEQLAEVKALTDLLIQAKVNKLDGLKRARVCSDDSQSPTEYHQLRVLTNLASGLVCSPYEISFQCFSGELASIMDKLVKSPHGFLIKTFAIESNAPVAMVIAPPSGPAPGFPPNFVPGGPPPRGGRPVGPANPGGIPGPPPQTGLVTVLNERPFRVTMLIDVVRAAQ